MPNTFWSVMVAVPRYAAASWRFTKWMMRPASSPLSSSLSPRVASAVARAACRPFADAVPVPLPRNVKKSLTTPPRTWESIFWSVLRTAFT